MQRRCDRYQKSENEEKTRSRVQKNKYLYDDMNNKIGYEEITNITTDTQIDLSSLNIKNPNREEYQKIKEYKQILTDDNQKEKKEEKQENKPKNFDINQVLEEAKRNRKTEDELEKKRSLNKEEYNVLSNLNKKYLHNKDFTDKDSDELKELIDTITSKTLVNDVKDEEEKELLSELLATTIDIKLEKELSSEDINKLYETNKDKVDGNENEEENLENSFYTHSMELSKEDLMEEDEEETLEEESKNKNIKILIIVLILLSILFVLAYFILKHFGIAFY